MLGRKRARQATVNFCFLANRTYILCSRVMLRAVEQVTVLPASSAVISTNIRIVRKFRSAIFNPPCVVQMMPLTSHWLAGYTRKAFDLKCGFINPAVTGRIYVIVYNHREFNAINVQKNSALGELFIHGFAYDTNQTDI